MQNNFIQELCLKLVFFSHPPGNNPLSALNEAQSRQQGFARILKVIKTNESQSAKHPKLQRMIWRYDVSSYVWACICCFKLHQNENSNFEAEATGHYFFFPDLHWPSQPGWSCLRGFPSCFAAAVAAAVRSRGCCSCAEEEMAWQRWGLDPCCHLETHSWPGEHLDLVGPAWHC